MAAWQKAGQIQNALTTFEEAVADGIADLDVYNAAIAACMNSKQSMVSKVAHLWYTLPLSTGSLHAESQQLMAQLANRRS